MTLTPRIVASQQPLTQTVTNQMTASTPLPVPCVEATTAVAMAPGKTTLALKIPILI